MAMTAEEFSEYRALYDAYAQKFRECSAAEQRVRAFHHELLARHRVPVGMGLDVWGDGNAKHRGDCTPAPEVV